MNHLGKISLAHEFLQREKNKTSGNYRANIIIRHYYTSNYMRLVKYVNVQRLN